MRRAILLPALLLAACGREGEEAAVRQQPVQTTDLTGLYQGAGDDARQSRMCMVVDGADSAGFGIVAWAANGGACSGVGTAAREGDHLRLTMDGDEHCVIEATIAGTEVALAGTVPAGCAYYCGAEGTFAGQRFEKIGGTRESAMQATDLAGDPLCAHLFTD